MITGYNTDVRHNNVVFHVQTEDKGVSNPFIESLIYVGGQVLAARRSSYAKLLADGHGEKEILGLMEQQHRTMIAAIRAGKFDAKLEALMGTGHTTEVAATSTTAVHPRLSSQVQPPDDDGTIAADPTLDQVILEYLTNEADQEQLLLMVDGDGALGLGQPASLAVRAMSSKSGNPVEGAHVKVRMISTVSEPQTLATGTTDGSGILNLAFRIPALDRGTAALIIVAASAIGTAEIKQLL